MIFIIVFDKSVSRLQSGSWHLDEAYVESLHVGLVAEFNSVGSVARYMGICLLTVLFTATADALGSCRSMFDHAVAHSSLLR